MRRHPAPAARTPLLLITCMVAMAVAGCEQAGNDQLTPPASTEPGAAPVEPTLPDVDDSHDDTTTMRYRCDGGWNVAVRDDVVQVTADDGRVIELQRVPGSSPPLFAGEALEFSVDGRGAVLGQDEGGPFACEEAP
jgi:hypothetical protein